MIHFVLSFAVIHDSTLIPMAVTQLLRPLLSPMDINSAAALAKCKSKGRVLGAGHFLSLPGCPVVHSTRQISVALLGWVDNIIATCKENFRPIYKKSS